HHRPQRGHHGSRSRRDHHRSRDQPGAAAHRCLWRIPPGSGRAHHRPHRRCHGQARHPRRRPRLLRLASDLSLKATSTEETIMALSNTDRIGRGFAALGVGLDAFLTKALRPTLGNTSWIDILENTDLKNGRTIGTYEATDPQTSLRFITEKTTARFKHGWYPLSDHLSRSQEA